MYFNAVEATLYLDKPEDNSVRVVLRLTPAVSTISFYRRRSTTSQDHTLACTCMHRKNRHGFHCTVSILCSMHDYVYAILSGKGKNLIHRTSADRQCFVTDL
jgi:hypothetical protein